MYLSVDILQVFNTPTHCAAHRALKCKGAESCQRETVSPIELWISQISCMVSSWWGDWWDSQHHRWSIAPLYLSWPTCKFHGSRCWYAWSEADQDSFQLVAELTDVRSSPSEDRGQRQPNNQHQSDCDNARRGPPKLQWVQWTVLLQWGCLVGCQQEWMGHFWLVEVSECDGRDGRRLF